MHNNFGLKMAKQSVLLVSIVYGLLITSVHGRLKIENNGDKSDSTYSSMIRDTISKLDLDSCNVKALGAAALVGTGAVIAAPVVLGAAGFTSAGVAAGSLAAFVQGPAVAAGGYFAALQSAGAAGLAVGTQVGIGTVAGVFGFGGYKAASGCTAPNCDTADKP